MNKEQAYKEGLEFTGHYERWYDRDKLKTIAKVIRKLYGCRVVMVEEGSGVALYADQKYRAIKCMDDVLRTLEQEQQARDAIMERYNEELRKLAERTKSAADTLAHIHAEYPELKDMKEVPEVYAYMRANNIPF